MPKRWPSVRGNREKSDQMPMVSPARQNFDFAFNTSAKVFVEAAKQTNSPTISRPNTSAGEESRSKKKKNLLLDPLAIRPRSSDGNSPIFTPKLRLARLEDGLIGLAIGSPSHPPETFSCLTFGSSPDRTLHAFVEQGPLPTQSSQSSRWKKFGGLFRSKSLSKISRAHRIQPSGMDDKKLGLPIQRNQWRNPGSPEQERFRHVTIAEFENSDGSTNTDKHEENTTSAVPSSMTAANPTRSRMPKLALKIPPAPANRHEPTLKKSEDLKSSQLLTRRNQNLKKLDTAHSQSLAVTDAGTVLIRPSTSPAMSNSPALGTPSSISRYSLFPTQIPPKPLNPPSALRNRLRASTLPAEMSTTQHSQKTNCTEKEQAESTARGKMENAIISPGDATASSADREAAPWESMESVNRIPSSRTSIDDEIFFDVKSFRNSNAVEDQGFVLTRPDSIAVQLARSNSNARKARQAMGLSSPEIAQEENKERSRTSIQIEEAIAIVERLTNPSQRDRLTSLSATHLPLPQPTIAELDANDTAVENRTNEALIEKDDGRTMQPLLVPRKKSSLKTRMEGMNIDVPSPVIELAEEASPHSPLSRSVVISPISLNASTKPQLERAASEVSSMTTSFNPTPPPPSRSPPPPPSNRSSLSSVSETPPPVPAKDTKFIPISKFAAKNTAELVIERTGLYPRNRPGRSRSVGHGSFSQRVSSLVPPDEFFPVSKIQKTTTMPIEPTGPLQTHEVSSPALNSPVGHKQTQSLAAITDVRPVAEVAVARKVSLSRRPSQKVQVSGMPSRKGSQKSLQAEIIEVGEGENLIEGQKAMLPIVKEVAKGHKPGRSVNLIVELATETTPRNSILSESTTTCRQSIATSLIVFGEEDEMNFSC